MIKEVSRLGKPLFSEVDVSKMKLEQFIDFYHVFYMLRSNNHLSELVNHELLKMKIIEYIFEVK